MADRGRIPLWTGEELNEVKPPKEEVRPLPEDKKENHKDEDYCADSTEPNCPFNNGFGEGFEAMAANHVLVLPHYAGVEFQWLCQLKKLLA